MNGTDAIQVVVAGHVCIDVIPTFGETVRPIEDILRPGHLTKVGPAVLSTGGVVSNTGLALFRLGVPVRLMGKVGRDLFGEAILGAFRAHDPALVDGMIVMENEITSYTLVLNPPGIDRIFLHCSGANDTFSAEDVPLDRILPARIFHFGYPPIMRRIYQDGGAELRKIFDAVRSLGVTTSFDMTQPDPHAEDGQVDWRAFLENVLPAVDVFVPNLTETLFMLDRERFDSLRTDSIESVLDPTLFRRLADELLALGAAVVGLKLGEHGLYLCTTDQVERLAHAGSAFAENQADWLNRELVTTCFQVDVRGTTGAGDCTVAGILASLLNSQGPDQAIIHATAVGACSVENADATSGVPSWAAVEERIASGWPRYPLGLELPGWSSDATGAVWFGPEDSGTLEILK